MTTKHVKTSRVWHVTLWIAQILLAGMFLAAGVMKTLTPIAELSQSLPMAAEMPILTRFIGIVELAGGLGLLLPAALRIWPQLTVLAAAGLGLVMVLALIFHIARGEYASIGINIALGTVSTFIAWGRLHKAPIISRFTKTHSVVRT